MAARLILHLTLLTSAMVQGFERDPRCNACACCIGGTAACNTNEVCTEGCINGYYGGKCLVYCPEGCVSCDRAYMQSYTCSACKDGYFNRQGTSNCTETTPPQCPENCKSCDNAGECTACNAGYYSALPAKDCSTPCQSPCTSCLSSPTNCTACEANYYLDIPGTCNPCRTGCAVCTSYNQCPLCEPNFTGSLCDSCVTGMGGVNCDINCPSTCQTCSSVDNCGLCVDGYYNGVSPDGGGAFYSDCRFRCPVSCFACTSSTRCPSCVSPSYKGTACDECVDGRYGTYCDDICPPNCICDRDLGNCLSCKSGFTGDKCDQCEVGSYGTDCDLPCSSNCLNARCGRDDHICTDGCISENIQGSYCNSCIAGYYSESCSVTCPENCNNDACDKNDGSCVYGCDGGFTGSLCDQCQIGKYGDNCGKDCSENCNNRECEKNTGKCVSCYPGLHGEYCLDNCSRNCIGKICDQNDGYCSNGCVSGFSGDLCCVNTINCEKCSSIDVCISCVQGWHSSRCEMKCSENCSDEGCNKSDGVCVGCKGHRYGDQCEKDCSENCFHTNATSRCDSKTGHCIGACVDGLYGSMCDETCSNNCNNKTCNKESASCLLGCKGGYTGTTCQEDEDSANNGLPIIGIVVGGTLGIAILVMLVLIFMKYRRIEQNYKHSRSHGEQDKPNNVYAELNMTEVSSSSRDYDSLEPPHVSHIPGSNADMDTPSSHVYQNDFV